MKTFLASLLIFIVISYNYSQSGYSVDEGYPVRVLDDKQSEYFQADYFFDDYKVIDKKAENQEYQIINIKGFNYKQEIGKPAVPMHNDIIAVPENADFKIEFTGYDFTDYKNITIYPAQEPGFDYVGAKKPDFVINKEFYQLDVEYPENLVNIIDTLYYRGVKMLVIQINPVQYNPKQKRARIYHHIYYKVNFNGSSGSFVDIKNHSYHSLKMLSSFVINNKSINEILKNYNNYKGLYGPSKNYIIFTHTDYKAAADSLANWKRQLGYSVEVVARNTWTTSDVDYELKTRYNNWFPKPDYFTIIGDNEDIPGTYATGYSGNFITDLYYVCMDGPGDYFPDMAKGRISVSSSSQAMNVVLKIIDYERFPVIDNQFYTNSVHCAYFQEDTLGYAERRFAQTAEEILQYMNGTIGFNIDRVYYTESNVNPTNWNNGEYSAGEPIPSYLLKPGFAWDGDAADITNSINNGVLYVLHRDHGYENGWGDPAYSNNEVNNLSNGNKLPVVFSINCLTGKFMEQECFSEAFLRKNNGGAVGVFGHAEVSMSGYNDGLAFGLFDAIWAVPGLVPNFTGTGNITGTVTSHSPITTMGDVANQGLMRMTETWGDGWGYEQYTYELLHYFGDPAMKIWTAIPSIITATHDTTIQCTDTIFHIYSSSLPNALATVVVDGQLIGSTQLSGGYGEIDISGIAGNFAYITVSMENYQPYFDVIPIYGGCPDAKFETNIIADCGINNQVEFINQSYGNINSYSWDFGNGAVPQTATGIGPHYVTYNSFGQKNIVLTVTGPAGSDIDSTTIVINEYCPFSMPALGSQTLTECNGILMDEGGYSNYNNNLDVVTTIQPPGAYQITLDFTEFDVEAGSGSVCDYDYVEIFDGPNVSSTSLGRFCNTTGSPGTITSSGGAITVLLHSDVAVTGTGFQATFNCMYPSQPPVADFTVSSTNTCTGIVSFNDISTNGPDTWYWDFGDGTFSTMQNPVHNYQTNGVYNVSLIASNSYGSDTIIYNSLITVNMPSPPSVVSDTSCVPDYFTLIAAGTGIQNWYTQPTGGTPFFTGSIYYTPLIYNTTTYYVENTIEQASQYVGETNDTTDGDFLSYEHYLVFDSYTDFILKSVEVNAASTDGRTIELRNASGTVIESINIVIPAGKSRIDLNFHIQPGNNYQLACKGAPNLFRSNANLNYPYEISGVVSIKGSSATSNPTGYYYYFYNWEVQEMPCISARVPVSAVVYEPNPVITPSDTTSVCTGDTTLLQCTPADSYYWYPNGENTQTINVTNPGIYYVEVVDNGCMGVSDTTYVVLTSNNPVADFYFINNDPVIEFINQSTDAYNFYWDFGDGDYSYDTNPVHLYSYDSTFTVTLIAYNGCGSDTVYDTVTVISTGNYSPEIDNIIIYPNPVGSILVVKTNDIEKMDISICNIYGEKVNNNQTCYNNNGFYYIDMSSYSSGVYFIIFETDNGKIIEKIIKI